MNKISQHIFLLLCFVASHVIEAQGLNVDFESTAPGVYTTSNAVSGWTISSQTVTNCNTSTVWQAGSPEFSVMSTPISNIPVIGTLPNSPLGGSNIVRLNNTTGNSTRTKIAQTFTLPYNNANYISGYLFKIAFAGIWETSGHLCCEQPAFKIEFKDYLGNLLTCSSESLIALGNTCATASSIYTVSSAVAWTTWQTRQVDLTMSSNTSSCITVEITNQDCALGDHYGTVFIDAICIPYWNGTQSSSNNNTSTVIICPGATTAAIALPTVSSCATYSWTYPVNSSTTSSTGYWCYVLPLLWQYMGIGQSTVSAATLYNVSPGSVYTLSISYPCSTCPTITRYYVIQTSTISATTYTNLTCPNGASGSATVLPNIAGINYNYSWVNSNNTVVSTNSFAPNLSAGLYSVTVSAPNFSSCGISTSTLLISPAPSSSSIILAPYCNNNEAYLNSYNNSASNFQWYSGTLAIPATQGGTAAPYTVLSPTNNSTLYSLAYNTPQGCRDSVKMVLVAASPGSITVSNATPACQGMSNGKITLSVMPTLFAPYYSPFSYFTAQNNGASTPVYIYSNSPISYSGYTLSNLYAGGIYSISVFDGSCKFSTTYTHTSSFDYTLSPSTINLCSGSNTLVTINTSGSPSSYTYLWSPSTFIANSNGQITAITPTTASGSSINIIYTVVVSPTINNCPFTKTLSVSVYHPVTPTLSALPMYCANAGTIDVSASVIPTGGIFYFNAYSNNGLLNTFLSNTGTNTYTYANFMGNCSANATGNYTINALPQISVASATNVICQGGHVTLNANGANSYTWSNGAQTPSIVVSPINTTQYNVSGTGGNGCVGDAAFTVSISPNIFPQISVSSTANVICEGSNVTLNANGANSYTWSNGEQTPSIVVSPTNTAQYDVSGTDENGCTGNAPFTVSVSPPPLLDVSGTFTLCRQQVQTLTVLGAYSYLWQWGTASWATSTFLIINPAVTTQYTVTGTSEIGCVSTKVVTVSIMECLGFEELKHENEELKIYPTPNNGKFIIETSTINYITITDVSGNIIFEKQLQTGKHEIDLSNFSNGIYFVKTSANKNKKMVKVN